MNTGIDSTFTGWIRRGLHGRWRLFCRADTLTLLLRDAPLGSDKLVRQGDADPNLDAPSRPRRRF